MRTLEDLLSVQSATNRARGRSYRAEGLVKVLERTDRLVRAVVHGTMRYTVQLALDGRAWRTSCTCPTYADNGACKHVCAVLYELTQGKARATAIACIDDDDALGDEWEGDEDEAWNGDELVERALVDPSVPDAVKRRLLEAFVNGDIFRGGMSEKTAEKHRTERLITTLDTLTPVTSTPRRTIALRYVLVSGAPDVNTVAMEVQAAKANAKGEFGAYKSVRTPPHDTDLDETDRMGKAVLVEGAREHGGGYYYSSRADRVLLSPALQRMFLPRFAAEDRLWIIADDGLDPAPVVLDAGEPWSFALEVASTAKEYVLTGALLRGEQRIPLEELFCVLAGGFAYARGALIPVDWHGAHA